MLTQAEVIDELKIIEAYARDNAQRLATQHGCEAGAARAREQGRLEACLDLRRALGLPTAVPD